MWFLYAQTAKQLGILLKQRTVRVSCATISKRVTVEHHACLLSPEPYTEQNPQASESFQYDGCIACFAISHFVISCNQTRLQRMILFGRLGEVRASENFLRDIHILYAVSLCRRSG